ncbi:glycerophosphodiester phosphodiesterase family protein [Acidicapsa ligni]|uniref:glycerophosphodiester phosphodiesterase family protein n=1 Tax=Acidicapsa ligni TaxID=542300 RepID=UPI0021E037DE|nr:glycerophosphodiester phosphodiesterase family protein [Acidicapsa ligni]
MKRIFVSMFFVSVAATTAHAAAVLPGPQLLCHRTANEDIPENTLESVEQAALLGCNVVELDLRRTLDGKIVLNHDGILERLTDGIGEAEKSYYGDLQLRDAGAWMGERFTGMHMVLFEDALRVARKMDIRLVVDMKTKGMGPEVLQILQREGMLEHVQFNGEWDDVKKLYPGARGAGDTAVWVQPGVTPAQVAAYHHEGNAVIVNFSANKHDLDLAGMKAAVAAGVDAINVDYPRLGADAVGRPVERKLHELILKADAGESDSRVAAILELSRYSGFPLQDDFARWLLDADDHVSRTAAQALVTARPRTAPAVFSAALVSEHSSARANAAWALGMLQAPASMLLPLLKDNDSLVLQQTLLSLARIPGEISSETLLPLLSNADPAVRGAASIALAQHQPEVAAKAIPTQLRIEMKDERVIYDDYIKRGKPKLTQAETDVIMSSFRCQIQMVHAISLVKNDAATRELEAQAFRVGEDFSEFNKIIAAFQLWDRIGADVEPAIQALGSSDGEAADRAEWMLVKAGPMVLPEVRKALDSDNSAVRRRAIHIVAWQGDTKSLDKLRAIHATGGPDAELSSWAITTIENLHS